MRHVANIMRPTDAEGTRGEREGTDPVYIREWPFKYKQVSGDVAAIVNTNAGYATGTCEGYADPTRPVAAGMFLTGGTLGDRKFYITNVEDKDGMGRKWLITYREKTSGKR